MTRILIIFIFTFLSTCAYSQKPNSNAKPFVLGIIEEIQSKELNEKRELNIYLPEGYNPKDTIKYPVIYLLDGSADEDFIHIVGLVQFNSFEWINQVPKSIVVGISTVDRRRDFTFPTTIEEDKKAYPTTGYSDKFISFIEKELQPYIQNKFKTNHSKTIIGQSLGGLLATEILFKKPTLFNKYIIVSPSLWWDNGSLLNQSVSNFENTDIYIGVGKEGLTPTLIPRIMEEDAKQLSEKIKKLKNKNVSVHFDFLPQENHATILHTAVNNAFKMLYSQITYSLNDTTMLTDENPQNDFDFHIGTWETKVKVLKNPLSGSDEWLEFEGTSIVSQICNGNANMVELDVKGISGKIEGVSLRLYNPKTQQWSLNYANMKTGVLEIPTVGSFKNGIGSFYNEDTFNGKKILVRFIISNITNKSIHFEQAFSIDNGTTWETNWIADDIRIR